MIEAILDHGAFGLGRDPTLLRQQLVYQKGDKTITGTAITENIARECYARVLHNADYTSLRRQVDEFNAQSKWVKRGIGVVGSKGNMGFMASDDINRGVAVVKLLPDGRVEVHHSGCELGQGIDTRMMQVRS